MQHSILDLGSAALIPELGADVAAGAAGDIQLVLVAIVALRGADDLMICSAERPMCIAGVFGGLDSGISDTTTDVFIESAYFNPVSVSYTHLSRKCGRTSRMFCGMFFSVSIGVAPTCTVATVAPHAIMI